MWVVFGLRQRDAAGREDTNGSSTRALSPLLEEHKGEHLALCDVRISQS